MSVSATMVKELREKTSAGMLDCKKALEEAKGDFEAAVEWLRVKGLSSAAKKSDRLASEGLVTACVKDGKVGCLLEVNSETDFVAKNEMFRAFNSDLANFIASSAAPANNEALLASTMNGAKVETTLKETIAKIGENLVLRRFFRMEGKGFVHSYVHGDGKIGVLVELSTAQNTEAVKTIANDICLHVAAMNPIALSADQVSPEVVEKEKEILKAKNLEQGKKAEMVDKIVEGQIRKFLSDSCLTEQSFVKNPDLKVKDYVTQAGKAFGENLTIVRFVRFELGEGLEKRANNFAEEVAAQTKAH
jgi:elongation factor Ts